MTGVGKIQEAHEAGQDNKRTVGRTPRAESRVALKCRKKTTREIHRLRDSLSSKFDLARTPGGSVWGRNGRSGRSRLVAKKRKINLSGTSAASAEVAKKRKINQSGMSAASADVNKGEGDERPASDAQPRSGEGDVGALVEAAKAKAGQPGGESEDGDAMEQDTESREDDYQDVEADWEDDAIAAPVVARSASWRARRTKNQARGGVAAVMTQAVDMVPYLAEMRKMMENVLDDKLTSQVKDIKNDMENMKKDILVNQEEALLNTNKDIKKIKEIQEEQGERLITQEDGLRRVTEGLKQLQNRVTQQNSRWRVETTIEVNNANTNKRQIVARNLGLGIQPRGRNREQNREYLAKDQEKFCEGVRQLMSDRLMELENLEAARGLSGKTLNGSILKVRRLGGREDAPNKPLLVTFNCEKDAQLVLSMGEAYKDDFRARLREYRRDREHARSSGEDENEIVRPQVLWIDRSDEPHILQEFQRLLKVAREINKKIREGQAPDGTKEVRVNKQRLIFTQEGVREAETRALVRELGGYAEGGGLTINGWTDGYAAEMKRRSEGATIMRPRGGQMGTQPAMVYGESPGGHDPPFSLL